MTPDDAARVVRPFFPATARLTVRPAGAGDYCEAFAVEDGWIFLFAKTEEASASLGRVAAVLPRIAALLPAPIPVPEHAGLGFVGYRRLDGRPLGAGLDGAARERCAAELAAFVRSLHALHADATGAVPLCEYGFAATEDGLRSGSAELEYGSDVDRLSVLPPPVVAKLQRALRAHLGGPPTEVALLHGELSCEHVLLDPASGALTGVIDFGGMVLGDPVRDLLYLHEELGEPFVELLLEHGALSEPRDAVLERVRFLRLWHTALRWLWLVDHGYDGGARLAELEALLAA